MIHNRRDRIWTGILSVYFICFAFRALEYFILRTDQTFLGEAVLHKLLGIVILFGALKIYGLTGKDIGLSEEEAIRSIFKGLVFGLAVFALAYSTEVLILAVGGQFESLELYVSAYSVTGNIGNQTALIFFVICMVGNIINVVMEEGIFRGLFQRMLEQNYSFFTAAVIASCLFGVWHMISPLRSYWDGTISQGGFLANTLLLVGTSGLVGLKLAMMCKLTGGLHMAMGDHFVNNTIVNLLHVVSSTGADQMQTMRISIAQSVSFVVVLVWYLLSKNKSGTAKA